MKLTPFLETCFTSCCMNTSAPARVMSVAEVKHPEPWGVLFPPVLITLQLVVIARVRITMTREAHQNEIREFSSVLDAPLRASDSCVRRQIQHSICRSRAARCHSQLPCSATWGSASEAITTMRRSTPDMRVHIPAARPQAPQSTYRARIVPQKTPTSVVIHEARRRPRSTSQTCIHCRAGIRNSAPSI